MRPKRLISLLVAVCMMITMLPLSAVTAFAEDTSPSTKQEAKNGYMYAYTVNGGNATITKFLGPVDSEGHVDSTNNGPYYIEIPSELGNCPVTGLGEHSFSTEDNGSPLYDIHHHNIQSVTIPESVTSIGQSAFESCFSLDSLIIKDAATSIGESAFDGCSHLTTLSLGKNITTIGDYAFQGCSYLTNVTIPQSVTSIGAYAFANCSNLRTITIPEKVTTIESDTFTGCSNLESITLPAGLKSFQDKLENCPAGNPDGAIYYKNYKAAADDLLADNDANDNIGANDKLRKRNFLYLCKVTFDAKGGTLTDKGGNPTDHAVVSAYKTEKINADDLAAIPNPTRAGYNFTGWYTADNQPFDVNEIITKGMTEDITLYAHWELAPKAPVCHPLTVTGGIVTVKNGDKDVTDTLTVTTDETTGKKTYSVPEGATVTVTLDKTLIPEGMVFDIWSTGKFSLPLGQDYKAESITFTMNTMSSDVDIAAQYRDATIEDDGPNVLGTAAIIGTAAVGTAVLGYQAYSLGAEFAGKLMALPYFPSNRSALAMMLWEDAGKPMPESELLYPDVGQEEQDMDLQHAARWAMENELIPDLNDEGTAPEEMKFFPANPVSKIDVLNAWQKAQELKNN